MSRSSAPPAISEVVRLSYTAAIDLANAISLPVNTWVDIGTNQSFVVASANSLIHLHATGVVLIGEAATNFSAISRLLIDSASTPLPKLLGGTYPSTGSYGNCLAGAGLVALGLAPGTHTVKLQVYANQVAKAFCRPVAQAPLEFLQFYVLERF